VRRLLPRTWIDATKCADGLQAIRDYRERIDQKKRVSLGPLHDWTSHAADALRYLMVSYDDRGPKDKPKLNLNQPSGGGWMAR
jgi:hypothetical protein